MKNKMIINKYYSEEVNHIMKQSLPNVLKWGWFIVISLFLSIVLCCYFIRYPHIVSYPVNLNKNTDLSTLTGMIFLSPNDTSLFVPGQKLQVKLTQYSYLEYGTLKGRIQSILFNPEIKKNIVTIEFLQGWTTSNGQKITFKEGLSGYCEVVTGEDRLIEKIYPSLLSNVK